jgi:hypothetical protein
VAQAHFSSRAEIRLLHVYEHTLIWHNLSCPNFRWLLCRKRLESKLERLLLPGTISTFKDNMIAAGCNEPVGRRSRPRQNSKVSSISVDPS